MKGDTRSLDYSSCVSTRWKLMKQSVRVPYSPCRAPSFSRANGTLFGQPTRKKQKALEHGAASQRSYNHSGAVEG